MKLKEIVEVSNNSELIGLLKIAVKRAAFAIIADQASPQPAKDWAKRARFVFKDDRTDFYAGLILEGALSEGGPFRDAVAADLQTPGSASLSDEVLITVVSTWVTRFTLLAI